MPPTPGWIRRTSSGEAVHMGRWKPGAISIRKKRGITPSASPAASGRTSSSTATRSSTSHPASHSMDSSPPPITWRPAKPIRFDCAHGNSVRKEPFHSNGANHPKRRVGMWTRMRYPLPSTFQRRVAWASVSSPHTSRSTPMSSCWPSNAPYRQTSTHRAYLSRSMSSWWTAQEIGSEPMFRSRRASTHPWPLQPRTPSLSVPKVYLTPSRCNWTGRRAMAQPIPATSRSKSVPPRVNAIQWEEMWNE